MIALGGDFPELSLYRRIEIINISLMTKQSSKVYLIGELPFTLTSNDGRGIHSVIPSNASSSW